VIRIGTSGWHYRHWKGPFYPEKFPAAKMLQFYRDRFMTVEINNSFYRLPTEAAIEEWKQAVPDDFVFAVKASRYITHMKRLKEPETSTEKFFAQVAHLGRKLGPILFQLPPRWNADPERLDAFLAALPRRRRYAFEMRDPSWFDDRVNKVLEKHHAAFCIYDFDRRQSPRTVTAGFVYVRLHGPDGKYAGTYSDEALADWARAFAAWDRAGKDVYCYFDNDQAGYAAKDALRLKQLTGA
jgi:uncharacterized protein YecE (DUF72 family)